MIPVAFYKDYVNGLKELVDEIRTHEDRFQIYELKAELLINRTLVSIAMTKRKGQSDFLFYLHDTATQKRTQLSAERAALLFDHFLALGEFLAVATVVPDAEQDAFAKAITGDWVYPACALALSYRKKGEPRAASTKMVFVGLNNQTEAQEYEDRTSVAEIIVRNRPLAAASLWEWK